MYDKKEIIIEINDMSKYDKISNIINRYCMLQSGGPKDLDIPGRGNGDYRPEFGIYKFNGGHDVNDLIKDLKMLCKYVTFKDIDSKKILQYIGTLIISFVNIKYLKPGTLKKLDEIKVLKTEFGYCKGNKPFMRPMETSHLINSGYSELIYLISDSIDNIIDLELLVENKVLEIDPNFKVEFRLFD